MRRSPWALEEGYLDLLTAVLRRAGEFEGDALAKHEVDALEDHLADSEDPWRFERAVLNAWVQHHFEVKPRQRETIISEMRAAGLIDRRDEGDTYELALPEAGRLAPLRGDHGPRLVLRDPDDEPLDTIPMPLVVQAITQRRLAWVDEREKYWARRVSRKTARRRIRAWEEDGLVERGGDRPHRWVRILAPLEDFPPLVACALAYYIARGVPHDPTAEDSLAALVPEAPAWALESG